MSGETEQNVSGWTVDTLNNMLTQSLNERDLRFEQRFLAQEQALVNAAEAERDHVNGVQKVIEQRLADIDRATELLNANVTRIPTDVDKQVGHLKEVVNEKFSSVALQFLERDTRGERETRDNTIKVDAAFSAQEKSASKQEESNQKAIAKAEAATTDNIDKLGQLFTTTTKAISDKIDSNAKIASDKSDDLKDGLKALELRVQGVEQRTSGGRSAREDQRSERDDQRQLVLAFVAVLAVLVSIGSVIAVILH